MVKCKLHSGQKEWDFAANTTSGICKYLHANAKLAKDPL